MAKFHINKNGTPAPCRAKEGNCPLGGHDSHYDIAEDAQSAADKLHQEEFGLFSVSNAEEINDTTK